MNELDDLITLGMILSNQQEAARVGNRTICLDLRPLIADKCHSHIYNINIDIT